MISYVLMISSMTSFMSFFFPPLQYMVIRDIKMIHSFIENKDGESGDTDDDDVQSETGESCPMAEVVGGDDEIDEGDGECVESKPLQDENKTDTVS
jgi:hypothetical protein